eukprot:755411-Hanusia_phi.AAC.2
MAESINASAISTVSSFSVSLPNPGLTSTCSRSISEEHTQQHALSTMSSDPSCPVPETASTR